MWERTKAWFKYSETILIARLWTAAGLITTADPDLIKQAVSDLINPRYVALAMLGFGVLLEMVRKRGDKEMN